MPEQGGGSELNRYKGAAVCYARSYTYIYIHLDLILIYTLIPLYSLDLQRS